MFFGYSEWSWFSKIALFFAALGSGSFLISFLLSSIGSNFEDVTDLDISDLSGFDGAAKIFSVQGLSCFFMIFGWSALAFEKEFNLPIILSLIFALGTGGIAVFIFSKLISLSGFLKQSGTIDINNALCNRGSVYLRIKPNQIGKVQIVVQGRQMILEAISAEDTVIETGENVEVIEVLEDRLIVKRAQY